MMKALLWMILVLVVLASANASSLAGPPQQEERYVSDLPNLGVAPELQNEIWLNTDQPLRLADLRGQVVLLHMWTFGCYNCVNTLPYMREWYDFYAPQGLVMIGNHYPEFAYERDLGNLQAALEDYAIEYPIAQDNERKTWAAYRNRYWPTIYLIDKWGNIRYRHIGEGRYAQTEEAIQDLLAETYP
jgi:thiol-disulfide isomerase/thioredoxin